MIAVWNLGNTTVRNPNRIEQGLKVFADGFQGRLHGKQEEIAFAQKLIEENIVNSNIGEKDWLGRKWRSAFTKLGFVTQPKYFIDDTSLSAIDFAKNHHNLHLQGLEYELTPAGINLLSANSTAAIQDVYLRQLIRHEIPSPIERGFPEGHLKPFIFLLQVLSSLEQLGQSGLNKIETALFLQPFHDHTPEHVSNTIEMINQYREGRRAVVGNVAKANYDIQYLNRVKHQISGPSTPTMLDYADTTFRYSQMSGLLTIHGESIIIRPEKVIIVDAILQNEPMFLAKDSPENYLVEFYLGSSLPTDEENFALTEIYNLRDEIRRLNSIPIIDIDLIDRNDIHKITDARYALIEQLSRLKEHQFATKQNEDESIIEILEYLEALSNRNHSNRSRIIDPPSYLEWSVWRGFLAINHIKSPIHETRRFSIDDDIKPRHPAPGGGADMIFEFDDFILLVEVTLTTATRQLYAEGEPVRRHVADAKEGKDKDVYCLFIAPNIDNNTAETFRIGVWYRGNAEDYLNIVPITLAQFIDLINVLRNHRFTPDQLQILLDRCLSYRNAKAPEWKRLIDRTTIAWCEQMSGN